MCKTYVSEDFPVMQHLLTLLCAFHLPSFSFTRSEGERSQGAELTWQGGAKDILVSDINNIRSKKTLASTKLQG